MKSHSTSQRAAAQTIRPRYTPQEMDQLIQLVDAMAEMQERLRPDRKPENLYAFGQEQQRLSDAIEKIHQRARRRGLQS